MVFGNKVKPQKPVTSFMMALRRVGENVALYRSIAQEIGGNC
jgi:hypothetical protein